MSCGILRLGSGKTVEFELNGRDLRTNVKLSDAELAEVYELFRVYGFMRPTDRRYDRSLH